MLQMASVYGLQQTAKRAPAFLLPKCAEVSSYDSLVALVAWPRNNVGNPIAVVACIVFSIAGSSRAQCAQTQTNQDTESLNI